MSAANAQGLLPLANPAALEHVLSASATRPQVIFKHSTRCATSSMALHRIERGMEKLQGMDVYLVDVIAQRSLSDAIAERLAEHHESPQALLLVGGEVRLVQNHLEVDPAELREVALQGR